jgi:hypothetical protein
MIEVMGFAEPVKNSVMIFPMMMGIVGIVIER